jgi:hypothetical protein
MDGKKINMVIVRENTECLVSAAFFSVCVSSFPILVRLFVLGLPGVSRRILLGLEAGCLVSRWMLDAAFTSRRPIMS